MLGGRETTLLTLLPAAPSSLFLQPLLCQKSLGFSLSFPSKQNCSALILLGPQGSSKGAITRCRSDGGNSINGKQDGWSFVPWCAAKLAWLPRGMESVTRTCLPWGPY